MTKFHTVTTRTIIVEAEDLARMIRAAIGAPDEVRVRCDHDARAIGEWTVPAVTR